MAVELMREPIRGQLETITNKEPDFVGLRVCTSQSFSPVLQEAKSFQVPIVLVMFIHK